VFPHSGEPPAVSRGDEVAGHPDFVALLGPSGEEDW
jgi:hypothetical protein